MKQINKRLDVGAYWEIGRDGFRVGDNVFAEVLSRNGNQVTIERHNGKIEVHQVFVDVDEYEDGGENITVHTENVKFKGGRSINASN